MPIHILRHGQTLCGHPGPPRVWPVDHMFVGEDNLEGANCPRCLQVLGAEKADVKSREVKVRIDRVGRSKPMPTDEEE